jgi:hypothetical protein
MNARIVATGLLALLVACHTTAYQAKFTQPSEAFAQLDETAPFLKCHLKDGRVFVFGKGWRVDSGAGEVRGEGIAYDLQRNAGTRTSLHVALPDVVLFETNRPEAIPRDAFTVLAVVTGVSLVVTAVCLSNPKACFGSCPTFYATDGTREVLQAEGFSASVAKIFEATDVDSMWTVKPDGRALDVLMTNDALETHAVDSVRVLAAPRPQGSRVLRAGDLYFPALAAHEPTRCASPLGSCLEDVRAVDEREYLSPASDVDLAEKEAIELTFPRGKGKVGLMVAGRNSLLNTFVFYQALAYMGRRAGDWFARLEQADLGASGFSAFGGLLGDVDVSVETPRGWEKAGAFAEVGPIAHEVQLVPLPDGLTGDEVHVRLSLARGNWKLDRLALVELGAPVVPVPLQPLKVTKDGQPAPDALARLVDPKRHLVTFPGDKYRMSFELPAGDHELFLESRGYYYEWIREEWLKEESAAEVARILLDPAGAMKRLAPKYKSIEGDMERIFWQSRFGSRP